MKIATKGPLECVPSDRDALHAQSRGMNKESAAAMWAIQQKKKKKKSNEMCHDSEQPSNRKILEIRGKVFPCKNIKLLLFKIKGNTIIRAYSSFVLSVFFVFK